MAPGFRVESAPSAMAASDVPERLKLLDGEFKSYLVELLDRIDQLAPRELIHYTTGDAALSILSTGLIRASDVFSMNDVEEISYGIRVVGTRLESRPHIPGEIRELFRPLEGRLNRFMETAKAWPIYSASFSTERHLASQWEAYADKGRGVAIVFNKERLCACAQEIGECSYFPIIYDEAKQAGVADTVAHMCEAHAADLRGSKQKTEYWSVAFADLAIASFRFKGKTWASENEWRLFWLSPRATPKIRPREAKEVRYIEARFTPAAISEVILGPRADASMQERIRSFLSSVEHDHIKVTTA
jgi:hypothetical protein